MVRNFTQNFDNEKQDKRNVLQVTKWFLMYNEKHSLRIEIGFPNDELLIYKLIRTNLGLISSKMKCQGSGTQKKTYVGPEKSFPHR